MSFTVYPKEGEPFGLEFAKFEFDGTNFAFYASRTPGARPSDQAYVSVAHVAAIIPNRLAHGRYGDEPRYRVYLKRRTQTIEVVTHEFDLTTYARVRGRRVVTRERLVAQSFLEMTNNPFGIFRDGEDQWFRTFSLLIEARPDDVNLRL